MSAKLYDLQTLIMSEVTCMSQLWTSFAKAVRDANMQTIYRF